MIDVAVVVNVDANRPCHDDGGVVLAIVIITVMSARTILLIFVTANTNRISIHLK